MPSIVGEQIFEVKDFQTIGTSTVLNVYYYRKRVGEPDPDAQGVGLGFELDVIDTMLQFQHTSLEHQEVEVRELLTLDNFANVPVAKFGTRGGNASTNFVALSVRINRGTRETRNGFKRIGGMLEDDKVQNFFDQTYVDAFVAAMNVPMLSITDTIETSILDLVIIRKTAPGSPVILPEDEWIYNPTTSIVASRTVRHQNTRLIGRGA